MDTLKDRCQFAEPIGTDPANSLNCDSANSRTFASRR